MLQSKLEVIFDNCFSPFEVDDHIHKTKRLNKNIEYFPLFLKRGRETMKWEMFVSSSVIWSE